MLRMKIGGTAVTSTHIRQHGVIFYKTVEYLSEGLKINYDYFNCLWNWNNRLVSETDNPFHFLQYYEYTDKVCVLFVRFVFQGINKSPTEDTKQLHSYSK
jgi:hypothetical protein